MTQVLPTRAESSSCCSRTLRGHKVCLSSPTQARSERFFPFSMIPLVFMVHPVAVKLPLHDSPPLFCRDPAEESDCAKAASGVSEPHLQHLRRLQPQCNVHNATVQRAFLGSSNSQVRSKRVSHTCDERFRIFIHVLEAGPKNEIWES